MTHSQRLLLADRYARSLGEGRIEDLIPILEAAETDPDLAALLIAISRGDAEEQGVALTPGERDEVVRRLADRIPSATAGRAGGRPFLIVLRDETGKSMRQAAEEINATANLCDDINTYYKTHTDPRIRALGWLLIAAANEVHQIPEAVGRDGMETDPSYDMAAYAEDELDRSFPTFEEILEDSGMSPEQQRRWAEEAERVVQEGHVTL